MHIYMRRQWVKFVGVLYTLPFAFPPTRSGLTTD